MARLPSISVIVAAYLSGRTLLTSLGTFTTQTYPDYEVIVVDSSPQDDCGESVRAAFPQVRYHHAEGRLLPHAARNRGVELSSGDLLVFTDPDIYAPPDWLAQIAAAHDSFGGIIAGSIESFHTRWADRAMHLSKFDMWLPGGRSRAIDSAASANMACARADFVRLGCLLEDRMAGDTELCWRFSAAGLPVTFVPAAFVLHDHEGKVSSLLGERMSRGRDFAELYGAGWSRARLLLQLGVTLLPVRLLKLTSRAVYHIWQAGQLRQSLDVLPMVVLAHAAWLRGEAQTYGVRLRERLAGDARPAADA